MIILLLCQDCEKDCGIGGRCRKASDESKLKCLSCAKGMMEIIFLKFFEIFNFEIRFNSFNIHQKKYIEIYLRTETEKWQMSLLG